MNVLDLLERVLWTAISAAAAAAIAVPVLDADAAKAAIAVGITAAVNAVLVVARWRLSILPNPGDGLPGLPTGGI